jgi:hypothetical protein
MRFLSWSVSFASLLAACSARTGLDVDGAGETTAGTGGRPSTSTSTDVGGGAPLSCDGLVLVDPPVALPTPATAARAPEIGLLPEGDAWISILESPTGTAGTLRVGRTNAFSEWPPNFVAMVDLDPAVVDYVTGPGAGAPVALIQHASDSFLATSLLPTLEGTELLTLTGPAATTTPSFAVGIEGRFLAAAIARQADLNQAVLHVGSYQPDSLPQSEPPLSCTKQAAPAAAIPTTGGFLAAYAMNNPPSDPCPVGDKPRPSVVTIARYGAPTEPGSFLTYEETDHAVLNDTVVHVALVPAPFGAWEVFQGAGDDARQPPAILAQRLGPDGISLDPPGGYTPISPDGVSSAFIGAAPLGDALVVAWTDALDPTAPTIVLQIVRSDLSLGPSASIPTNVVWQTGRIRMVASPEARSLLVAWEGGVDAPAVGLARLDCVTGL